MEKIQAIDRDDRMGYLFLLTPYALAPMALSVLMGRRLAIFAAVFTSLLGCLLVVETLLFDYLLGALLCGLVAVYSTHELRKRSRLTQAGLFVGSTTLVLAFTLGHIAVFTANQDSIDWVFIGVQCLTALFAGIFSATLIGGILPVLESLFRLTSNMSWIELTDLNHPLLKRMTMEAPGTYHHSLIVANLASAAAEKVGANATMCRACAYFHDIGKLAKPLYFIENSSQAGVKNPHDDLAASMSTLVIVSHVKEGVDLAIQNKLNSQIIDVIREHHGTSLVYYFYRRALKKQEEVRAAVEAGEANEEDIPEVKEQRFRYPGPIPQTVESAIISLADSVESACRSMTKPTPAKVEQMIDDIFNKRMKDGQLDDCQMTLAELSDVKESFFSTLSGMTHQRVSYEDDEEE
ncbi:MAG: HDIG domain-containing metalloprotein, partial [Verrucomicrobiota bacterium]